MKKINFTTVLSVILIVFTFSSCRTDIATFQNTVTFKGKIYGIISNKLIKHADISIGNIKVKSNENGEFEIPKLKTKVDYIVNIEHDNFVSVTRKIKFELTKEMDVNFPLIPRGKEQLVNSSDTTITNFEGGGKIVILPNSFITEDKNIYRGRVSLKVTFINPQINNLIVASPSTFISEENRPLQSFGMLEIYAATLQGERLQITEKSPIRVSLPNISNLSANVGFYYLNTETGRWAERGLLTYDKQTNTLLGEVISISSAWNADEPCSDQLVCVRIQIVDEQNNPDNRFIAAEGVSYNGFDGWYQTDQSGFADLYVCPNGVFKILGGLIPCCDAGDVPGTPDYIFCCDNGGMVQGPTIDMSTITLTPPCTFLGQATF